MHSPSASTCSEASRRRPRARVAWAPARAGLALLALVAGCSTYHAPAITSNPRGARIWAGARPDGLRPMHHRTPRPAHSIPFATRCYRVKLAGYVPSDVMCVDTREARELHFELSPRRARLRSRDVAAPLSASRGDGVQVHVVSRRIFDLVALGESEAELTARLGSPQRRVGNELVWAGLGPGTALGVTSFDGHVAGVAALYETRTWATLREVETRLREQYGEPHTADEFPPHATRDADRQAEIAAGRARVHRTWDAGSYDVDLTWDRTGLVLRYRLETLWARMERAEADAY